MGDTVDDAVLAVGQRLLITARDRPNGVGVVGLDEHVWRHTRRGDQYVTVIIKLTPVRDGTGPSLLLAMLESRSKKAFKDWPPSATRSGLMVLELWRWTSSPGSRPPPPTNCPRRWQ